MADNLNQTDSQPIPLTNNSSNFWTWFQIEGESRLNRVYVPLLLVIQFAYTIWRITLGDWLTVGISVIGIVLMIFLSGVIPAQLRFLGHRFTRSHAFYIFVFWVYGQLFIFVYRVLSTFPITGKESEPFYIFLLMLLLVTFRLLVSLFALTPLGYRIFISNIPVWEQFMVAINEFISVSILAFVAGRLIARFLQADIFTLQSNIYYNASLLLLALTYFLLMQGMWIGIWNRWLSRNNVWVRLARLLTPIALVIASIVILRHFTNLSEPRTANLLGGVVIDETILALSPILWMMIFFVLIVVYSGGRGLRRLLIPNKLMAHLPEPLERRLKTISDMDILLLFAILATVIPVQILFFNNTTLIGDLQASLQGNAIIDSSQQALALIFGIPFYLVILILMIIYAFVMANRTISARDRNAIVDKLPLTLLIMFIITLYLAAIPFSQVLSSGEIPNIQQDLGYILAFNVLIPLVLFYIHYYLLIRVPYGRGQARWREQHTVTLENRLTRVEENLASLEKDIHQCEIVWQNRDNLRSTKDEQIAMLFDLIDLNGKRDRLNMERLQILADRQELQDVTDAPISLTVASLPTRIFQYGIPLVLAFKIYEWAIVNDGLREVANNPNLTVFEFFQQILENTNF